MKKIILALSILAVVACGKVEENKVVNNTTTSINVKDIKDDSAYLEFLNSKYLNTNEIYSIELAPYSKGIDIVFETKSETMDKAVYEQMANDVANSYREYKGNKDIKVGIIVDYKKDANTDSVNIYGDKF